MDPKITVHRHPDRGHYDRETVNSILDEGFVCHIAFFSEGDVYNLPMTYVRIADSIYVHASNKSRIYSTLSSGARACITVTLLDGIVLAKSVYNNSMNYRSAMILGSFVPVLENEEKMRAAEELTEKLTKGRWDDSRIPSSGELKVTGFLRMPISEFSSKIRSGPPIDNGEDLKLPYWTGIIPLKLQREAPIPSEPIDTPAYLR